MASKFEVGKTYKGKTTGAKYEVVSVDSATGEATTLQGPRLIHQEYYEEVSEIDQSDPNYGNCLSCGSSALKGTKKPCRVCSNNSAAISKDTCYWTPATNVNSETTAPAEKRTFETGAVRDKATGKGRCDLLPTAALLRIAKHMETGAEHYGYRNWEAGIPISCFMDSGLRHLFNYLDGQTDEDHLVAAAWNIICAMWTEEKHPELQDIPARKVGGAVAQDDSKG